LKNAETALNGLNEIADNTILFIWNEVETKYGDKPKPTQRDFARLWGVKYARAGGHKIVSGDTIDEATGEGIAGVEIYFDNGNNSAESGLDYKFSLNTTLMDVQKLIATHPDYVLWEGNETLVEGENLVITIKMTRRV
jgi:hypothetical protein